APDLPIELGEGHFRWLAAAAERGLAPMEALRAATSNVAAAYGHADDLGTLEPGKSADLVILGADPLEDARNYRQIVAVMKDGAPGDRDNLPVRPILTAGDRDRPAAARTA